MKSKQWLTFLVIVLFASNAYLAFKVFDNGVTITYQDASLESVQKDYEQAMRIANLNLVGKDARTAIQLIGRDVYGKEPFEKEGCLYVGGICLRLNNNRVVVGVGGNAL